MYKGKDLNNLFSVVIPIFRFYNFDETHYILYIWKPVPLLKRILLYIENIFLILDRLIN